MFLEGQGVDHERAGRGASLWMGGLAAWLVATIGRSILHWHLFRDGGGSFGSHELTQAVSAGLQLLGIGAGLAVAAGAWRWVRATEPVAWLSVAAGSLAAEPLVDGIYLALSLTSMPGDYLAREGLYTALGHAWTLCALLNAAVFVLLFLRMARLSEAQGWELSPARVWSAVAAVAFWGLLIATARLQLFVLTGGWGQVFDVGVVAFICGSGIALLRPHRAQLRAGAVAAGPRPPSEGPVAGLADAGRGLGRYHAAVVSQIGFLIVGNLLTLGAARSGDAEAARGLMVVVMVIALGIQLVAIAGLARFARELPSSLQDAKGSATTAVAAQGLNLLLGVIGLGMVIRAFESNRLSLLFDLRDQLPIFEGIGTLLGCVAAVAVLSAIERSGALGSRPQAGMLKAAIPTIGVAAMIFKLLDHRDLGAVGVLGLGFMLLVGAITVAVSFLRLVRRAADAMQLQA